MRLRTIHESMGTRHKIRKVKTILGEMTIDDSLFKKRKVNEAGLSLELKPAAFNVALKKALKMAGANVKNVRIVNSYKWPDCYVQVYGEIPNDIRLAVLKAEGNDLKGVRDLEDINYGNVTSSRTSTKAKFWVSVIDSLAGSSESPAE